jgi:hypothetical protein
MASPVSADVHPARAHHASKLNEVAGGILGWMASAPESRGALQKRTAGIIAVIVSGLVFVGALGLLDWAGLPKAVALGGTISIVSRSATLWDFRGHQADILTLIAAGTVAFAVMALLSDSVITTLPAVCGSFYLLGRTFPVGDGYGGYRLGFWIAAAAALAMSISGLLAIVGAAGFASAPQGTSG